MAKYWTYSYQLNHQQTSKVGRDFSVISRLWKSKYTWNDVISLIAKTRMETPGPLRVFFFIYSAGARTAGYPDLHLWPMLCIPVNVRVCVCVASAGTHVMAIYLPPTLLTLWSSSTRFHNSAFCHLKPPSRPFKSVVLLQSSLPNSVYHFLYWYFPLPVALSLLSSSISFFLVGGRREDA